MPGPEQITESFGRTASTYWLTLSLLFGAVVLVVGLAPRPLMLIGATLLVAGLIGTGHVFGQLRWIPDMNGRPSSAVLGFAAAVAMTVPVLLRGSDPAPFLIPPFSIAVAVTCYFWMKRQGLYVQPRSSADGIAPGRTP